MIQVLNRRQMKKAFPIVVNASTAKAFVVDGAGGHWGFSTMEQALAFAEYLKRKI